MVQKVLNINGLKFGDRKTRIPILINMLIKLQKAMLSLNKYEHCMFQSQAPRCFVYCSYRGNRYITAVPKVKAAGRERISFSIIPSAIFKCKRVD